MTTNPESVIIVAGGSGSRMKANLPKQFLQIAGKPILMQTIRRFYIYNPQVELIVVLPQDQIAFWEELCEQHAFELKHKIVSGGATRFQSVKNGLSAIQQKGEVAVHDGVRPFVSEKIIAEAFHVAREKGNAVVSVALKDSIREIQGENNRAADRSQFRLIQTPQCFQFELLQKAYGLPEENTFTDDASVVEKLGVKINLTEGSYENIKITTPEDLFLAEALLKKR